MNNAVVWGMQLHPTYLWTLPLFHCNGWCFPYTITMQAGVHVCLRSIDTTSIFSAIGSQQVSHMCGAPVIMNMMLHGTPDEHAPLHERAASGSEPVRMFTAGAPPPPAVIEGMEALGMDITHVYGLTEIYGPASARARDPSSTHALNPPHGHTCLRASASTGASAHANGASFGGRSTLWHATAPSPLPACPVGP